MYDIKERGCCCGCLHFICRTIIVLTLLAGLAGMFVYFDQIKDRLNFFIIWVCHHQYQGPLLIVGVYVICELIFIPSTVVTVGTGFALREGYKSAAKAMIIGTPACFIGACLAAIISFLLGRYVFQECAQKMARNYPTIYAFDRAVRDQGIVLVFLLRLCPLIPFSLMNFILGITSLTWCHFVTSFIAIIPSTVLYILIGTQITEVAQIVTGKIKGTAQDQLVLYSIVGGTFLGLVGVCWISCVANRYLREAIAM